MQIVTHLSIIAIDDYILNVNNWTGITSWNLLNSLFELLTWTFVFSRSKKDKSKGVMKPDSSDPEPEGLTLLVPDIQKTAEIVYAATTSLRQANQGAFTLQQRELDSNPLRAARN